MPTGERPLVLCSKGVEERSGKLLHDVAHEVCASAPIAVLSGPSFAHEVAAGFPTAVTLACQDRALGEELRARINLTNFRIYCTDDVAGAEAGGAVKNVLAIACGIVDGKGFGQSARAAVIARGFAEMTRFGVAMGGRRETFMGLAGLGDLVLTCTDDQSRNRRMGLALAKGRSVAQALAEIRQVVEGVRVAPEVMRLARKHGVDMPISEQVVKVLAGEITAVDAVRSLATRPPRAEAG